MKRVIIFAIIVHILLLLLLFCGCVERFIGESTEPDAPKLLTPEDIESIFASVTVDEINKYPIETDTAGNEIVYWLKGGEVWHSSKSCGSISRAESDAVSKGIIADAIAAGKKRACKICSDGDETMIFDSTVVSTNDTVTPATETEILVDSDTIVYWLKSGSVWHFNYNCSSLSGSDKSTIISGELKEACAQGKERGCKNCASDVIVDSTYSETTAFEITEVLTEAITDKYPAEYGEDGKQIVFWLESSKIWHLSRHCSSLSRTDPAKLISGVVEEAIKAGKERVCKNCS